jgi:hypothetical protein
MSTEAVQAGIQSELDELAPSGGTLVVDGSYSSATRGISLSIPLGVHLLWTAKYELSIQSGEAALNLSGDGAFNMQNNGMIANIGRFGTALAATGNVTITVSRSSVTADGFAIMANGSVVIDDGAAVSAGTRGVVSSSGVVTMRGGSVTASGDGGTAIESPGGRISIQGGIVSAVGKGGIAAHCKGEYLTLGGNAIVYTMRPLPASANSLKTGVVFTGNEGVAYGNFTLINDLEVPGGAALRLAKNATLTVPAGITLRLKSGSTLDNSVGSVINQGTIKNAGTITDHLNWNGNPFEDTSGEKEGGVFSWF